MKSTAAFFAVLFASLSSQSAPIDRLELRSADLIKQGSIEHAELILTFQDRQAVSGVCDLTLSRFEYVEALQGLIVDFKPAKFCPREDMGKRQGQVKWQLPSQLYQSANLKIIVNDRALSDVKIVKGQIIVKTKP